MQQHGQNMAYGDTSIPQRQPCNNVLDGVVPAYRLLSPNSENGSSSWPPLGYVDAAAK